MLSRLVFFLLLLANVGYFGWESYQAQSTRPAGPTTQPIASDAPTLTLLSEREEQLLASSAGTDISLAPGESACFSLGPFVTQADLRRAFNVIAPFVERSRQRQTVETRDRGYWVYLPAMPTREEALAVARELAVIGLRDYYVVTSGDEENTLSLGLFREEHNARRRQSALRSLGFEAEMARRSEESINYWLDYAEAADQSPPWERVVASNNGVNRQPVHCFLAQ